MKMLKKFKDNLIIGLKLYCKNFMVYLSSNDLVVVNKLKSKSIITFE